MILNKKEKKELSKYRIEKAEKILKDAELLLNKSRAESSINRSYYASLNAAKAALILFGLDPKTHEGVKSMVNKKLVLEGVMPKEYGKWFRNLLFERENADYSDYIVVELAEAEEAFRQSSSFIKKIKEILPNLIKQMQ